MVTHPFIVRFREDVDFVAEVSDFYEHDLVAVVIPVVSQVDCRIVRCFAMKECSLIDQNGVISRLMVYHYGGYM